MHVKADVDLQDASHRTCSKSTCKIACLGDLDMHLGLYLDELDRVFFNKESQRNRISWWLSAFYSFVIQGFVRRALIEILSTQLPKRDFRGVTQYLHLAIRLFIASSGSLDLLVRVPSVGSTSDSLKEFDDQYQLARIAVGYAEWESMGISNSAEYLRRLFEDVGDVLVRNLKFV